MGESEKGLPSDESTALLLLGGSKALARRRGVSLRTLRRQFAACGTTLAEFVRARRIELTMSLVRNGGAPLQRAAQTLGFSSESSFARFVRRELGRAPRDLREEGPEGSGAGSDVKRARARRLAPR